MLPLINGNVKDSISSKGYKIKTIANNSTMLEASYSPYNFEQLNEEKMNTLASAKENITWLTLSGLKLQDEWLSNIGQFENLTKLRLDQTMITDAGIKHLEALEHLEYLNVYGTQLTDEAVERQFKACTYYVGGEKN